MSRKRGEKKQEDAGQKREREGQGIRDEERMEECRTSVLLDHEFLPFRTMTHIDKWLLLNVLFVFKTVARKGVELFSEENDLKIWRNKGKEEVWKVI